MPSPFSGRDPDLHLNLQDLFTLAYDRGRYRRALNDSAPPPVALSAEDLQWAAELAKG